MQSSEATACSNCVVLVLRTESYLNILIIIIIIFETSPVTEQVTIPHTLISAKLFLVVMHSALPAWTVP